MEVAPYRYRFADANGIVENEICPILVAYADAEPQPNSNEIDAWKWIAWEAFLEDIKKNPHIYSPWSIEEARILQNLNFFNRSIRHCSNVVPVGGSSTKKCVACDHDGVVGT